MKNTCKIYEENNIRYQFAARNLLMLINQRKHSFQTTGTKMTKTAIMEEIADKLFVSSEAVKNWMYGYNGPSEIEQVKKLGDYFEVDYHQLLVREDEPMNNMEKRIDYLTEAQIDYTKNRVREIYKAIVDYYHNCRSYYYIFKAKQENELSEEDVKEMYLANGELKRDFSRITDLLEYSMLDLPEDFYNKVLAYLWVDMIDYIDVITCPKSDNNDEWEQYSEWKEVVENMYESLGEFLKNEYQKELRELFKDYIVDFAGVRNEEIQHEMETVIED